MISYKKKALLAVTKLSRRFYFADHSCAMDHQMRRYFIEFA